MDDGATTAVFDVERIGTDMLAVPFPSELHRDASGAVLLGEIPGARDGAAFDALREMMAARTGYCTTCGAFFAIEGSLDEASLPDPDATGEAPGLHHPVILVDIDEASPEQGRVLPVRVRYFASEGIVAVRPAPGLVLARNRLYAVALTSTVRDSDGEPLSASPDFRAIRDGAGGDDRLASARAIVAPAIDALVDLGAEREAIVALSPFRTGDATKELRRVKAIAQESAAPTATFDRAFFGDELDALLGEVAEARPGVDVPPAAMTEGTRAIPHASTAMVVTGTFDAPRLVSGSGGDVGTPLRDASGQLMAGPREAVPFVLIVPEGADLARLPVVLSLHGFNSSRVIGFALADTAGPEGVAVLAIDYYQHGERAASAVDERHAMRGDLEGPDGFAETSPLDVSARVFGVTGVMSGSELSPRYALGSLLQFASDAMSALRLLREGDLSALQAGVPELSALAFDPDRVFVVGNSLGAEVGTFVLSVDDPVRGAVLNVPPGSIVDNLVESPEFRPLTETLFLPLLGITGPFFEPARGLSFDLVIDLYRSALESVDPLALAPHLVRDRVATGATPELILQLGALDEVAAPRASESMVAALGIDASPPLTLARVYDAATVGTAVAHRLEGGHGMLEIRYQESRFVAPAVPPFESRDPPIVVDNPISEVHAQIAEMLRN